MKHDVYILFFLIICCFKSYGQANKIDSLEQLYHSAKSDSSKIKALKNISWEYLSNRSNMEKAEFYIDSLYSYSEDVQSSFGILLAKYQYGVLERQKGNYDQALVYFDEYIKITKANNDDIEMANALYQKAIILDNLGHYEKSLEIYYQILDIYRDNNDETSAANILNSLGEILKETGKVNRALENYNKALVIYKKYNDKSEMANCYFNIGDTYILLKKYDEALVYLNKALELDKEVGSVWGAAYDYESIGQVYSLKGDYQKALNIHLEALQLREQLKQKRELSGAHTKVGVDYLNLKEFEKSQKHLNLSLDYAIKIGALKEKREALRWLSALKTEMRDYKSALEYKQQFIDVKDSLFNEAKSRQVQELQERFDSEKKENAILALENETQLKELKLKEQTAFRNITLAIAIATIMISFLLFHRYKTIQSVKDAKKEKELEVLEEQRKTELEKQRVAELEKVDKLKDEFLANTSHELRTPLHGIIGLSESLKDGAAGHLPAQAKENLEMIANSGKRLANLVNDILDFSKLKNKDLNLSLQPVDVYAIVGLVLKVSGSLGKSKELTLSNLIPRDVPLVTADENRLQQILYNLIGNAIKFTEKGKVEVYAHEEGEMLSISISDTGIGIPEDDFENIFKSFEQVDGGDERTQGGTGLGLSVSKQLIELHGGELLVESELNLGSVFTFTLPLSDKQRLTVTDHEPLEFDKINDIEKETTEIDIHKLQSEELNNKILIIDDEVINRRVLENHLTLAGYSVVEVGSASEALELLENVSSFDLILLDIMMPKMSGYEVCEVIRKKYSASELPIVLLTAKNRVNDLVAGFNVGANDYLTKPFSKNELLSRIKTHLNLNGIHKATSKFVPTEFLKSVGRDMVTDVVLGDHKEKEVTVLFSDIRDYTGLSETMQPEENFNFVNAYVGRMGPLIQKHNGFVNQYLGDGIMALFPKDASFALKACIDMQKAIETYNYSRLNEGYRQISVGMGLHTGPLIMGIIGDHFRNDTAIIADTVNTASRMEGVTKFYGANIVVSGACLKTFNNQDEFNLRYLGKVKAKGKQNIVDIYECFDGDNDDCIAMKIETLSDFQKASKHFFNKEFPKASAAFDKVLSRNPNDKVAKYFITKAAEYTISGIPEDWDMVNVMQKK